MNYKKQNKKLSDYPCEDFLHNALTLINKAEFDAAYNEICWAIIKSGGTLTEKERKIFYED
jgi:hypothetical protein